MILMIRWKVYCIYQTVKELLIGKVDVEQPACWKSITTVSNIFLTHIFPENEEREACALGLRSPFTQRLSFDSFKTR